MALGLKLNFENSVLFVLRIRFVLLQVYSREWGQLQYVGEDRKHAGNIEIRNGGTVHSYPLLTLTFYFPERELFANARCLQLRATGPIATSSSICHFAFSPAFFPHNSSGAHLLVQAHSSFRLS